MYYPRMYLCVTRDQAWLYAIQGCTRDTLTESYGIVGQGYDCVLLYPSPRYTRESWQLCSVACYQRIYFCVTIKCCNSE